MDTPPSQTQFSTDASTSARRPRRNQKLTFWIGPDKCLVLIGFDSTMKEIDRVSTQFRKHVKSAMKQKIEAPTLMAILYDQAHR